MRGLDGAGCTEEGPPPAHCLWSHQPLLLLLPKHLQPRWVICCVVLVVPNSHPQSVTLGQVNIIVRQKPTVLQDQPEATHVCGKQNIKISGDQHILLDKSYKIDYLKKKYNYN